MTSWHDELERPIKRNYSVGEEFTLEDMYALEDDLAELYPRNRHLRDTIRDVLQDLRNEGLIEFLGEKGSPEAGHYRRIA